MKEKMIHPTSIVDEGVSIGAGTKIWHFCHVQAGASIGENCSFGQNVYIGSGVRIGNGVRVQNNVSLYEGVEVEDRVFLGPSCVFTNDLTPRAAFPKERSQYRKTLVKEGASIGANATIVCGRVIGRWALIGAGSVVTKDVPDFGLMMGVPARQRGWACKCGSKLNEKLLCPCCGRAYRKTEAGIEEAPEE